MSGCGRNIPVVLHGRTVYVQCVRHDDHGCCQGWLTDVTTRPV